MTVAVHRKAQQLFLLHWFRVIQVRKRDRSCNLLNIERFDAHTPPPPSPQTRHHAVTLAQAPTIMQRVLLQPQQLSGGQGEGALRGKLRDVDGELRGCQGSSW